MKSFLFKNFSRHVRIFTHWYSQIVLLYLIYWHPLFGTKSLSAQSEYTKQTNTTFASHSPTVKMMQLNVDSNLQTCTVNRFQIPIVSNVCFPLFRLIGLVQHS